MSFSRVAKCLIGAGVTTGVAIGVYNRREIYSNYQRLFVPEYGLQQLINNQDVDKLKQLINEGEFVYTTQFGQEYSVDTYEVAKSAVRNNQHQIVEFLIDGCYFNTEGYSNLLVVCIREGGDIETFKLLLSKSKLEYGHFYQMGENNRVRELAELCSVVNYRALADGIISGGHYLDYEGIFSLFTDINDEKLHTMVSISMMNRHYSQGRILLGEIKEPDYDILLRYCVDDKCKRIIQTYKQKHE